jgi:hypothetical protein
MNKLKEEIDKRYGSFELSNEKNKSIVNNIEEFTSNIAIKFAEFLRINYQNSALEFDNYWEKVEQGEFCLELGKAYTTKELFKEFIENHYKK